MTLRELSEKDVIQIQTGEKLGRIAEILNITESNAKTSLCRTRKKVKKYLTERGYDQYEGFK